jgi:hypothetical protein
MFVQAHFAGGFVAVAEAIAQHLISSFTGPLPSYSHVLLPSSFFTLHLETLSGSDGNASFVITNMCLAKARSLKAFVFVTSLTLSCLRSFLFTWLASLCTSTTSTARSNYCVRTWRRRLKILPISSACWGAACQGMLPR